MWRICNQAGQDRPREAASAFKKKVGIGFAIAAWCNDRVQCNDLGSKVVSGIFPSYPFPH